MRTDLLTSYLWPLGGESFDTPTAAAKRTHALAVDGVGDLKPPVPPAVLITSDTVPDAPDTAGGSNPAIAVTPPGVTTPIVSTIDTLGDQDFYRVTLTAGVAYEFGLYSYNGGPNLAGLTDPYLELYAADGTTLVVSADGGANTPYNEINSGFDVLLTYTPTASGTYFVNARAFSNSPLTSTGDSVGDYQLFVRQQDPNDPTIYRPYYEPTEPLYAIDWGTQVDKVNTTARNPDGDDGTRATGNPQGSPTHSSAFDVAALAAAQGVSIAGKNVITIYFAQAGDVFVSNDPTNPGLPPATITAVGVQAFERTAVLTSLGEFAKVADVVYLEVGDRDHADFIYTSYTGTPGPGVSLLGSMSPPGESDEGLAQFNSGDYRWNATDLQQGGFSFVTLIHEFGHGHGLAHPHDNGGHSGIMNGVEQESPTSVANYTTGDYALNQGVFTMMSYEDGWQSSPYGNAPTDVGYGYLGGLMAFDIAAIQDKYGVNEDWATGNDVYTLRDVNAAGTYYSAIWDGGGTDAIVYAGSRDATIDLRAATLRYEIGGGGRVSFASGIFGGFTIANGVAIENAVSGAGRDRLFGNDGANLLNGGGGADVMTGGPGDDWFYVDNALDVVIEGPGAGTDRVFASVSYALGGGQHIETLSTTDSAGTAAINLTGNELANTILGNAGNNALDGGAGTDTLYGYGGNDWFHVDSAADAVVEGVGAGTDRVFSSVSYTLAAGAHVETLSTSSNAGTAAIDLTGNGYANTLIGNAGANTLDGGAGADTLYGYGGNDWFYVDHAGDAVFEGAGAGTDRVFASASYALGTGTQVETLSTTSTAGTAAINLTGNEHANTLVGNAGNNVLNGGAAADALFGYGGNDWYFVDHADDAVFEGAGAGADRVFASASYKLGAGAQVEMLSTDSSAGTAAIDLTGNELANELFGNAGSNVLDGRGGADLLNGYTGADIFRFSTALGGGNVDTLHGFDPVDDTIQLDDAVFAGLAPGALPAGAFHTGAGAADADDRIIYNDLTGALWFDADGNGAGAAVQFAILQDGLAVTAGDFIVI